MSFYLLDTNILIDLAGKKNSAPFFKALLKNPALRLATSILCVAEYLSGADRKEEKYLKDWLNSGELEVLFLDSIEHAMAGANLRKREGLTLPDALILASAIRYKAHLLTRDEIFLKKAGDFVAASDPVSKT